MGGVKALLALMSFRPKALNYVLPCHFDRSIRMYAKRRNPLNEVRPKSVISTEAYECMRSGEIPQTKSRLRSCRFLDCARNDSSIKSRLRSCRFLDCARRSCRFLDCARNDSSIKSGLRSCRFLDCARNDRACKSTGVLPFSIKNSNCTPHLQL